MKKLHYLLAVIAALCGLCVMSCKSQSYYDACHMSDLIRAYCDAIETDTTANAVLFRKLCELNLRDKEITKKTVDLNKYVYGY